MNDDSLDVLYSPRKPIRRHAFAIRHMILEEIKYRRFQLKAAPNPNLDERLTQLARRVIVEQVAGGYAVSVEGQVLLKLAVDDLKLYTRGDTPRHVEQQAVQHLRNDKTSDRVLDHNRQRITEIVDFLLQHISQGPYPASEV